MCARVQCVWTGSKSTASSFRTGVCLSTCLKQGLSKIISARLYQRSCSPLVGILNGSLLCFVKHAVTLWFFSNTVPEDGSQDLTFYWLLLLRPGHISWLELSNTSKFRVLSNCIRKADGIFSAVTGAIKEKKLTKLIRLPVSFLP